MSTINILFIFEGADTEDIITKSLEKYILKEKPIIKCVFGAEIYQLYREIKKDNDLDTFNLLKEKNVNKEILKNFRRNDFAEIYLFFDYDAQAPLASPQDRYGNSVKEGDEKLKDMLNFFDNETDKGKLYISYPMVEALRHITDFNLFKDLEVKCKRKNCHYRDMCEEQDDCMKEPHYKTIVSKESIPQLCNINSYTKETWKQLLNVHLSKMNYIVNNQYEYPSKIEIQIDIFEKQLDKYVNRKCPKVSVLSAFPVFIHDYYGNEKTKILIR